MSYLERIRFTEVGEMCNVVEKPEETSGRNSANKG